MAKSSDAVDRGWGMKFRIMTDDIMFWVERFVGEKVFFFDFGNWLLCSMRYSTEKEAMYKLKYMVRIEIQKKNIKVVYEERV